MYSLKTIATEQGLLIGKNLFNHGEILAFLLNQDFSDLLKLEDFITSLFDREVTEEILDKAIDSFTKIDKRIMKFPFFEGVLSKEYLLSTGLSKKVEDEDYTLREITRSYAMLYVNFLNDLREVNGFYKTYIGEYYHDFDHYPKADDIGKSFNKYKEDYPKEIQFEDDSKIKFLPPTMAKLFATPIITEVGRVYEQFFHESLSTLAYLDFMECVRNQVMPKKCKNCNKFYIPSFGYFSEYCNEIAPNEKVKTCREIGSKASFDNKLNQNPILKEYQKAYKTHHARFVKKKMTKEELSQWKVFAKDMMEQVQADKITFEHYLSEIKK